MYGNVPILEHHATEITTGYTPSNRQTVWEFCKKDFEYAAVNLPKTASKPGKLTRAAADHYLAEISLALGDFDNAVAASTRVIDGTDGDYHLMTTRFGSRAGEATDRYGNSLAAPAGAYWDLSVKVATRTQQITKKLFGFANIIMELTLPVAAVMNGAY